MFYPDLPPEVWLAQSPEWTTMMRKEALSASQSTSTPEPSANESTSKYGLIAFSVATTLLLSCFATLTFGAVKATEGMVQLHQRQHSLLVQKGTWTDLRHLR